MAWTPHGLEGAAERLARWRAATALRTAPSAEATLARVREVLSDDLRTPAALDAIDDWCFRALNTGGDDPNAAALVANVADALLGIRL